MSLCSAHAATALSFVSTLVTPLIIHTLFSFYFPWWTATNSLAIVWSRLPNLHWTTHFAAGNVQADTHAGARL
jgi:hypothetical protein